MKKLNVTKGEFEVSKYPFLNVSQKNKGTCICQLSDIKATTKYPFMSDEYDIEEKRCANEKQANATLIADSFNTYNECEILPSDLLKQRNELLEALTYFVKRVEEGTIKSNTTYNMYKSIIENIK